MTEKLTRTGEKDIFYEFTVNDPENYTQPWKAELSFYPQSRALRVRLPRGQLRHRRHAGRRAGEGAAGGCGEGEAGGGQAGEGRAIAAPRISGAQGVGVFHAAGFTNASY